MLAANGAARRYGEDKLLLILAGRPLLLWSLLAIADTCLFDVVIVVAPSVRHAAIGLAAGQARIGQLVLAEGGEDRQSSVRAGVEHCPGDIDLICVHDAARPLAPASAFHRVVAAAEAMGAATTALDAVDLVKRVDEDRRVMATLERQHLVQAQTPQAFDAQLLRSAHARAVADGFVGADDCSLVERLGRPVQVVDGDARSIKLTTPDQFRLLEALAQGGAADG